MKYLDDIKFTRALLCSIGVAGILLSIAGLLILHVFEPDFLLTNDLNSSILDDTVLFVIMLFVFTVYLIGGIFYSRLYRWVWYSLFWTSRVGIFMAVGFAVLYLSKAMITHPFTLCFLLLYGIFSIAVYLKIYDLKVKALFRIWERTILSR